MNEMPGSPEDRKLWTISRIRGLFGRITVEAEGSTVFVRMTLSEAPLLLRGPDLSPSARIVDVRMGLRLRHDRPRSPGSVQTERLHLRFNVENPAFPDRYPWMEVDVSSSDEWREVTMSPSIDCCPDPLVVRYAYVSFGQTTPTTIDIDWVKFDQPLTHSSARQWDRRHWPGAQG